MPSLSGDDGRGDPLVPIPNTIVKPSSADGTWGENPWESRSLPGNQKQPNLFGLAVFCLDLCSGLNKDNHKGMEILEYRKKS